MSLKFQDKRSRKEVTAMKKYIIRILILVIVMLIAFAKNAK